jgi:lysophospholipase L1-like esterase
MNQWIIYSLNPRLTVLLIGTNDLGGGAHEAFVVGNIELISNHIQTNNPGCKVLLLGILPRKMLRFIRIFELSTLRSKSAPTMSPSSFHSQHGGRVFERAGSIRFKPEMPEDGIHLIQMQRRLRT